jgi:hypothetical protein
MDEPWSAIQMRASVTPAPRRSRLGVMLEMEAEER